MAYVRTCMSQMATAHIRITASSRTTTPMRIKNASEEDLDCWPPLPLVINNFSGCFEDEDNLVAALEHPDRICKISLCARRPPSDATIKMFQQPFPALTYFQLSSDDKIIRALPDGFLGGYSPRLLELCLEGIQFPALTKLLSSTSTL
ncbi:hypothetical protein B0F90DRAFT_405697 [Multifurca ochricompacta]|uniref:Uncharacterized protein n=1 Tax=Multifurca ochricompacta TaxID=376703 RepID=A0AAD4LX79_9AGAM|nr:hypothetical protein B0F90DRAFT_405697 [Multifurca ochricompacta]